MANPQDVLDLSEMTTARPNARADSNSRHIFATHLLAFLIASSGAFLPRNGMLLPGTDGEFARTTANLLFRFADPSLGLSMAPFEGLGTLFLYNPLLSPSLLPIPLFDEKIGVWLSFVICAGLIFVSTYVLGRALGMGRGSSLLAAWALPPLCLPYQPWINLYLSYSLNPMAGDIMSGTMLGLALLARGYTTSRPYRIALGLTAVVVWLFLTNPLWIVLLLPTATAASIGIITMHARRPDFLRRSGVLILPSVVFVAAGGAAYLLGLYANTAVAFFPQEMNRSLAHSWRFFTVATAWNTGIDPIGGSWVGLALLGFALAIWRGPRPLSIAALSVLGAVIFFAGYGTAYLTSSFWVLPYPVYFEFFLWPFYALFAAYAIGTLAKYVANGMCRYVPRLAAQFECARPMPWGYFCLWALIGVAIGVLLARFPFTVPATAALGPPADTAITKALNLASGIKPKGGFNGYATSLTGFNGPDGAPTDWFALQEESNRALLTFGNQHRMVYLWRFGIPSFEAYSQIVEPAFYGLVTRLLDRPADRQVRNIIIVTQTNIALMESLGIRFLVTDYPLPEPARLVVRLTTPAISHFVFELPDPNYGGFSPTEVVVARNATDVLQRIADRGFDFRKTVVLDEPLRQALQPAKSSEVTIVRGGWRIKAQSSGASMLLLPLQFTHCLSLRERPGVSGKVLSLRRANLVSTALLFEGAVDVTLSLHYSPFWNPYCRLRDAREMKEFGLARLPRKISPVGDSAAD